MEGISEDHPDLAGDHHTLFRAGLTTGDYLGHSLVRVLAFPRVETSQSHWAS